MLEQVERLVAEGLALHWLHPKSKRPIGNDWSTRPVATAEELRKRYREGMNLGLRPGKWSDLGGLFLHIIDMDVRKPEFAEDARGKLKDLLPELDLETCATVISGSGGESRHFYILTDRAFPPRKFAHSATFEKEWDEVRGKEVKKWDWELHLLGTGANAAIPPSIHDKTGRPYRWLREIDFDALDDGTIETIPSEALERVVGYVQPEDGKLDKGEPLDISDGDLIDILEDLPFDEWIEDRDGWYRVGMALHHQFDGAKKGFDLWCQYSKKSNKFDEKDSKRVWRSFGKNSGAKPFRMASLLAVAKDVRVEREFDDLDLDDFDDLGDEEEAEKDEGDDDDIFGFLAKDRPNPKPSHVKLAKEEREFELGREIPQWIEKMNKKHAIARVNSRTVVMDFHPDQRVTYGPVGDLHVFYENERRPAEGGTQPKSKQWLMSKFRRTYPNGIVFLPNQEVEGTYNHWQGFSVEPADVKDASRGCKLFLKHVRDVICSGDEEKYQYMLGWMAHLVQKPEEKPGVAIVYRGKKGTGKDTVFNYLGRLIRNHYIVLANQDQLVGKFNQHEEKCLLLHAEEGFWAGDKKAQGSLQTKITSEHVMIEPKGMNAFQIKSCLRLFISSNERWVVPASEDERRYFVLNVSEKHRRDSNYFKALRAELEGSGPSHLLTYLMRLDISDFQVRDVPDTEALAEQKAQGLRNVERWWHEVLQHGSMTGISARIWAEQGVTIEKDEFKDAYSKWMRSRRYDGEEVSEVELGKRMKVVLPEIMQTRPRHKGIRTNLYVLPDLDACRRSFERYLGSELIWPDDQMIEVEPEEDDL